MVNYIQVQNLDLAFFRHIVTELLSAVPVPRKFINLEI